MTKIRLQGPENFGGFSHNGQSYEPDDEGVIEVPADISNEVLAAHGLKPAVAKTFRPLAKGKGVTDDTPGEPAERVQEAEPLKSAQKGAKAAKGGAE